MNVNYFVTLIVSAVLAMVSTSAAESIRVAIADNQRSVSLQAAAGLHVEGATNHRLEKSVIYRAAGIGSKPVRVSSSQGQVKVNGHSYRGTIELRKKSSGTLLVINDLDLESYLLGVVAAEIPADWEMEALKAQAVASRTYALYQKKNAGKRLYHILATVDSQMYLGKRGERQRAAQAIAETRGMIITYRGEIICILPLKLRRAHRGRPRTLGHR